MAAGQIAGIHAWEQGGGASTVLCLHETGATGEVWRPLADSLAARARVVAYDRPGWGASATPDTYLRTTVGEQAAVAASLLAERGGVPAVLCGAGLGAVAALELLLRRPELVTGAVLVEPPLLAFVPEATSALADAAVAVRETVAERGRGAALERYQAGGFGILSAGAERLDARARAVGDRAAAALFAELAAVPAWDLPTDELGVAVRPTVIVVGAGTPPLVRDAADRLAGVLARSQVRDVGAGLPHHDQPETVAEMILELAEGG